MRRTSFRRIILCILRASGNSSASTHHFPATLHFQTASFTESDICKLCRMQRPVPGTTHIVVVSPLCTLTSSYFSALAMLVGLGSCENTMSCTSISSWESGKRDVFPAACGKQYRQTHMNANHTG